MVSLFFLKQKVFEEPEAYLIGGIAKALGDRLIKIGLKSYTAFKQEKEKKEKRKLKTNWLTLWFIKKRDKSILKSITKKIPGLNYESLPDKLNESSIKEFIFCVKDNISISKFKMVSFIHDSFVF